MKHDRSRTTHTPNHVAQAITYETPPERLTPLTVPLLLTPRASRRILPPARALFESSSQADTFEQVGASSELTRRRRQREPFGRPSHLGVAVFGNCDHGRDFVEQSVVLENAANRVSDGFLIQHHLQDVLGGPERAVREVPSAIGPAPSDTRTRSAVITRSADGPVCFWSHSTGCRESSRHLPQRNFVHYVRLEVPLKARFA